MICEFRPKNIMISDFWAEKLHNSGMAHFISYNKFDGKKAISPRKCFKMATNFN